MQKMDGKQYHVAVALRENGRLDFYSDFRLVDQSLEGETYTDIQCDFKQFYFRRQGSVSTTSKKGNKIKVGHQSLSASDLFKSAL